ncbi:MAG: hypothetical protein ACK4RM_01120 [Flavobacterium sp.]
MDSIISYTREIPLFKRILCIALMIVGCYIFLFENIFVGIMMAVIGLNLFVTEGSEINLSAKTHRKVKSVIGFKFGKWQPIPEFEYVSVFKTKEGTEVSAMGATIGTFKNEVIFLNMFSKNNRYFTCYKTEDRTDAFYVAEHLKLALNIDILDATGPEKKWL